MYITRLQVEGGAFFQHLDLSFRPGLNTLIGARGTGKTTIIELLRFGLGARSQTPEEGALSERHAKNVLGGGELNITLDDGGEIIHVSRDAESADPVSTDIFRPPIVFSQKEIESVGLTAFGRLTLLDGFRRVKGGTRQRTLALLASIKSVDAEIFESAATIRDARENLPDFASLKAREAAALAEQSKLAGSSDATIEKQVRLSTISEELSRIILSANIVERFSGNTAQWINRLEGALSNETSGDVAVLPGGEPDPILAVRPAYAAAIKDVTRALAGFKSVMPPLENARADYSKRRANLDLQGKSLRGEIEDLVAGAGTTERTLAAIRKQISDGRAAQASIQERTEKLLSQRGRRDVLLDELDQMRRARFDERRIIADRLNESLRPQVAITVSQSALYADYTRSLAEKLRGMGLRHNEVAATISESVSPRELVRWTESLDVAALAEACSFTRERSERVLNALNIGSFGDILTCTIEDSVQITFLDNTTYKDITSLSAGQRCTAILPIVLQHSDRIVIIDQPEDHIDNAYIATTIVKSLRARDPKSQIIVSTHNANIPVLGSASTVIELASDGRTGSVRVAEPLDHPDSVDAITSIMEGGEEAFRERSRFYEENAL